MVNETSGTTAARLTPVVGISRPEFNQGAGGLTGPAGQNLPVDGTSAPKLQPQPNRLELAQSSSGIKEAVREINEYVQNVQRDLSFNMDEVSGRTVIKVIDRDSGDTVRQIPSEEVLAIARTIRDARDSAVSREKIPAGLLFSENT